MKKLGDIFEIVNARSGSFSSYDRGSVAFVTNSTRDNGVLGYVKPTESDRVFDEPAIVVSTFCDAAVHLPPFLPRGNGGSGLLVLKPRDRPLSVTQLAIYAAHINTALCWRFSWYRQVTKERLAKCDLPRLRQTDLPFTAGVLLPPRKHTESKRVRLGSKRFSLFELHELFNVVSGIHHEAHTLPPGDLPLVSCGEIDHGIIAFVSAPADTVYSNALTIAFNGRPLTTHYHPYRFTPKDDVAVCLPKDRMKPEVMFFIACQLNAEKWRYSYYRKCFQQKLGRQAVKLPSNRGKIDVATIERCCAVSPYWRWLREQFRPSVVAKRELRDNRPRARKVAGQRGQATV